MTANHILIPGLILVLLILAALPLARRAVLLLTAKYLVKRRLAWVSLMAVALCVALVLIVLSVMSGWLENFRNSFKTMTGDLIVSRSSQSGFPHYEEMIREIEKLPQVEAACPLIKTAGLLYFPLDWNNYVGVVGVPSVERIDRVMGFTHSLWFQREIAEWNESHAPLRSPATFELWPGVDYAAIAPNDRQAARRPGMIVGAGAIDIGKDPKTGKPDWSTSLVGIQGRLTVVPNVDGIGGGGTEINASTTNYWIVDGSRTQTMQHDKNVYVPFDQLQRDLHLNASSYTDTVTGARQEEPARTTEIHIKLRPGVDGKAMKPVVQRVVDGVMRRHMLAPVEVATTQPGVTTMAADLSRIEIGLGGLRVQTWEDQQSTFLNAVENEITIMMVLFGVISLVAVFMIFCIFYTIVAEKTRDVGILKSVGASAWNVAQIFLTYGAAIGFVGGGLGVLMGWLFVRYINEINTGLAVIIGRPIYNSDVYALDKLPTTIDVREAIVIWMIGIAAAVIGAVLPAIRAARLNPVEALRFE